MREHKLIGESDSFLQTLEHISYLTHLNRPVLVVGERGTGKELIAERLHFLSDRWAKPLLKLNCATMHENLLESDLFGHEAGAFTGASKRHIGRFERASGGTLFLDELATLSGTTQEKLLRIIEYGEYERLGGSTTLKADTRLVAATNLDLPSYADRGRFRHDLLDRLAFDVVTLPPLRARQEDIALLANHFAVQMCKELGRPFFGGFSASVTAVMQSHPWPGNIRELKNVVERAVYRLQDHEQPVTEIILDPFASPYRLTTEVSSSGSPNVIQRSKEVCPPKDHQVDDEDLMMLPTDYQQSRANYEKRLLQRALKSANFNQKHAARLLSLSYHQLRNQLKKHQLPGSQAGEDT